MSIFISIASYKDPETIPTILDCYNKAKKREDLRFGVLLQEDSGFSKKEKLTKEIDVSFIDCDWRESRGACWARHTIQKVLFNNEDYYLQLDSHHRFCEHWDQILINGIENLKNKHSDKPIIGGYCPGYTPAKDHVLEDSPAMITSFPEFTELGDLMFRPKRIANHIQLKEKGVNFIKARFLSGHFIFSDSSLIKDCPYDPLLYFRGEELSLSARAYTWGYDFFHPTSSIVWHEYIRSSQTKHWDDHKKQKGFLVTSDKRSDEAKKRVRQLLGMETKNRSFGKYDIGKKRDLHEYELYAGLNFSKKLVHKYSFNINATAPQPYVMSEKDWEEGMLKSYFVEFDVPAGFVKDFLDKGASSFAFIFYGNNNHTVYRRDIKKENFLHYNTNLIKVKGNMEDKPTRLTIAPFSDKNIRIPSIPIKSLRVS